MTVLMSPDMANFSGNVHGGAILKLLDQVAYSCASRYSGCYTVTLSVDQVMFLQPIPIQGPPHRGGIFSVAVSRPTARRETPGRLRKKGAPADARCLVAIGMMTKANVCYLSGLFELEVSVRVALVEPSRRASTGSA